MTDPLQRRIDGSLQESILQAHTAGVLATQAYVR